MNNLIYTVNLINGSVNYVDPLSDEGMTVKYAQQEIPKVNETFDTKTGEEIKAEIPLTADLSVRNYKNTYIIPTEKSRVLLNLIPQKIFVTDTNIIDFIDVSFKHFVDDYSEGAPPDLFTLADGLFFRYVENGPKPIDQYTYYIMDNGEPKVIPNYKTLEVMLFERGQNYQSVRIIEKSQFDEIMNGSIPEMKIDMEAQWKAEMEDQVNFGKYLDLVKTAAGAGAIADAAAAEADKNIKAYKAEKDAEKAKADQAKAEAEAAKAASDAAIAQAKAAEANAQAQEAKAKQAEAEAKQKEAEAEQTRAELEAQKT